MTSRREVLVRNLRVIIDGDRVDVHSGQRLVGLGRFRAGSFVAYVDLARTSAATLDAIEEALRELEREAVDGTG